MRNPFTKEIVRSVTGSWGRFIAIVAIVALGTGFYAGLRMTAPDMKLAADVYYDGTALMDVRVVSTLGLTDDDMKALESVEGVEAVMPAYETDAMTTINGEQYAVRVHSLSDAASSSDTSDGVNAKTDDDSYVNRPILVEGSWPSAPDECVLSADKVMNTPTSLGDVVTVSETTQDGALSQTSYTVVGYVHAPYYASSTAMGSTSLGSGSIQQFMYIPVSGFSDDIPFTEAFITVAGAAAERSGTDAYRTCVQETVDRIKALAPEREKARAADLKDEAQAKLDEKRADFAQQKTEALDALDQAADQLEAARSQLDASASQLAEARASYDAGVTQLADQRASVEQELAAKEAQLAEGRAALHEGASTLDAAQSQLDAGKAQWQAAYDALDPNDPAYGPTLAALQAQKQQLDAQQTALDQQKGVLAQRSAQLDEGAKALEDGRAQAAASFAAAQAELDAGWSQLQTGEAQLAQGEADYASGKKTYEEQRTQAEEGFAQAQKQIDDAQKQIDDIADAEWLVMDRDQNYGVTSFNADADRVDSIARVFPFVFFLVAALVSLTTMTRMVEEERVLIGTHKALGYGRARIMSKYLAYAALASVLGSLIGITVLSQVLPATIMQAYAIIYFVPAGPRPIDPGLAGLSAGLGVGITLAATLAAAAATLRESPAALMLPRAPKAGKRILLERAAPVWSRLSFSWKVTLRNLFRYKRRFIMTVVGIAGCTALLLTGLGLQDSINDIIDKQYGELLHYNAIVTEEDDASPADMRAVDEIMADPNYVIDSTPAAEQNTLARTAAGGDLRATLVVPEDPEAFGQFVTMRTREGHEQVSLGQDGVVVSEKLATKLGLNVGDAFELVEQDAMGNATNETHELVVTGIIENYIYHYVFLGPEKYQELFGETADYDARYALTTTDAGAREQLTDDLRAIDGVKTVAYNDETIDAYRTMLKSVNLIVIVLVVAAAALAFIVLYNLTNINITERQREIATLKVLGFTPREMDAYIFREIMLLSVIGCIVGLGLGVLLEGFVVVTAEVDQVMFGRTIHPASFAVAFVLTMVFTALVMLAMRRKLHVVDMVESLKSVE